jgi:DMSO/TMAO reductase YedYZ molybdopterin-dependent catalytic subunit
LVIFAYLLRSFKSMPRVIMLVRVNTNKKRLLTSLTLTFITFFLLSSASTSAGSNGTLQITNLSGATITLIYEDLLALPQTVVYANLACYGNPIENGNWQGVKLSELLNQAGVDPFVESIDFKAQDGYSVSMPIDTAQRDDVIVAYQLDGKPLGENLRLVVPGANGNVWIALIISITMTSTPLESSIAAGNPVPMFQYGSHIETTQPSNPPVQIRPTPTPIEHQNVTTAPTESPANVTQPQSLQQDLAQKNVKLSPETIYVMVSIVLSGIVVACFVIYKRRKLNI